MTSRFRRAKGLPAWRRIAVNAWSAPREATIHGSMEIDAGAALTFIEARRARGTRVTITHVVAKAIAGAIARMPQVNGIVSRGRLMLRDSVDLFLQVALDDGESLSGTTIRNADLKSVEEIAGELAVRVEEIRTHSDPVLEKTTSTLARVPDRLLGPLMRFLAWAQYDRGLDLRRIGVEYDSFGSAMVTNVGMFGLQQGFAPAFPLGRTAIVVLVGEVADRPAVVEGRVEVRPMLGLHATLDHRVVDGYHAGRLASHVREALADPERFLVG